MHQLADRLAHLDFDADLRVEHAGRSAHIQSTQRSITVNVPNVATGLLFLRSALPRPFRSSLSLLPKLGFTLEVRVGTRNVLAIASGKSGVLAWVGLPNLRVNPIALGLLLLGR